MLDDAKRWDYIHQKTHEDGDGHSVYAEEKEKLFPRGSVICDLGGGTGADAVYFLKMGHSVILFDISEFALNVAQKKAKEAGVEKALVVKQVDFGLHELPLQDNSIDVAYSRISLHYFPTNETIGIFSSIFKALKPGGSAYITFKSPDDEREMEYLRENAAEYEQDVFIENGQLRGRFSVEKLKEMLLQAGISNFQVHPYKEALKSDGGGNQQVLLLNEIIFSK